MILRWAADEHGVDVGFVQHLLVVVVGLAYSVFFGYFLEAGFIDVGYCFKSIAWEALERRNVHGCGDFSAADNSHLHDLSRSFSVCSASLLSERLYIKDFLILIMTVSPRPFN